MSTLLDETKEHVADQPFLGLSDEDSYPISIPDGEQFDRVDLKILRSTRGGANITGAPAPGQTGEQELRVHWWYDAALLPGRPPGRIKYQVQAFSVPLPIDTATRLLDYRAASQAGATFHHNIDPSSGPFYRLGVGDWLDVGWAPSSWEWEGGRKPGVLFVADLGVPFALHGIKANPEAYKDFRLKNGWKIKAIALNHWRLGKTAFKFLHRPSIGSDDPFMHVHVRAEPMGSFIRSAVIVVIEGPKGRDPYHA